MKTLTLLSIAFVVASAALTTGAAAQCAPSPSPCWTTSSAGSTTTYTTCCNYSNSGNCDTLARTADEIRQCKLDYWRKEVDANRKTLEQVQHNLDYAQDRVKAFEK